MNHTDAILRRDLLATAGAAFTTTLFTGRLKGANDCAAIGFTGVGAMGSANLGYAMKALAAQPVARCDVYQPQLEPTEFAARRSASRQGPEGFP